MKRFCFDSLLNLHEFTAGLNFLSIVDVGAQILNYEDHIYQPVVNVIPSQIVGFEPVKAARENRQSEDNDTKTLILPYVVGDGSEETFYETANSALSSTYKPNAAYRKNFVGGHRMYEIANVDRLKTTRLDDVPEIKMCDFLKLDTQGGEFNIINGCKELLKNTLIIHTESFFLPFYENMPLWSDLDPLIRDQGFELIDIFPGGKRISAFGEIKDQMFPSNLSQPSRLVWADFCYINTSALNGNMTSEQLKKSALCMHFVYKKFDVTATILSKHDEVYHTNYLGLYLQDA